MSIHSSELALSNQFKNLIGEEGAAYLEDGDMGLMSELLCEGLGIHKQDSMSYNRSRMVSIFRAALNSLPVLRG